MPSGDGQSIEHVNVGICKPVGHEQLRAGYAPGSSTSTIRRLEMREISVIWAAFLECDAGAAGNDGAKSERKFNHG
jgi:hypothetical protein